MATVCVLITTPPSPDPEVAEMILALAAFDHEVQVIVKGAGLGWLVRGQLSRKPAGKSPDKVIGALPMYDVESIFYSTDDLALSPFAGASLQSFARGMSNPELQALLASADHCVSF
ncbi:hypothetical protein ACQUQU_07045 [Thalassolituus sp. LLYu03]|uniref:hypothetical protein n=1 Tax=Thalassolituus sp. LLYu03 TaxID=3421656 RepID=UPI003D2BA3AE